MNKSISHKTRLLIGASTLLLTSTAAMAADNVTIDSTIVTLDADAAQSTDQLNTKAVTVSSTNTGATAGVDSTTTVGDTTDGLVVVDNNNNKFNALGNLAEQSLGDTGSAATDTSVALGTLQDSTGATDITVGATASSNDTTISIGEIDGSTVTLSNSTNAATATTNSSSQTVVLKSTTLDTAGTPLVTDVQADVSGDIAVAGDVAVGSSQITAKSKTEATNATSTFKMTATDDVDTSALKLISNTQDATAIGSTATNAVSLSATSSNMGVGIVSQQSSDVDSDVTAATSATILMSLVDPTTTPAIGAADLTDSSAMVSANRIDAMASGGVTSNLLSVDATTLTGASGATTSVAFTVGTAPTFDTVASDAQFTVANQQVAAENTISANVTASAIGFTMDGETSGSSVAVEGNVIDAFGLSNKSTNSLALAGTSITTDAGVINRQESEADVVSGIGTSGLLVEIGAGLDGDVDVSSIAVNSNVLRGSATGNIANNTLTASATTLLGLGTDDTPAVSAGVASTGAASGTGDFSLVNSQALVSGASSKTDVYAQFGISVADDADITDSRLSVSSNSQFAEALGNSGTNRIALTATGAGALTAVNPTASLSNVQDGDSADIDSTSNMTVFANADTSGSSVALNGNSNTALGVVNNAINSISVSAVTLKGDNAVASITASSNSTTADYALNSVQDASGNVDSTATSSIYNFDKTDAIPVGTDASVITMTGNATTAEGSANRVANQLSVSATDNGATAALNNSQDSTAIVNATATSTVGYTITGAVAVVAATDSSIAINGNSTVSLARGNSASNILNYTVGASYTGNTGADITGVTTVAANAAVLNNQSNGGAVIATSTGAEYTLDLASASGVNAALNSNATIANNTVVANAFGNTATNSLTMSTFGSGVPSSAVASIQSNTAAVSAYATNVTFGMTVGQNSGSALRVSGNNTTAQAFGNSSVNSISGGN